MPTWRALVFALSLMLLAAPLTHAQLTGNSTYVRQSTEQSFYLDTSGTYVGTQPGHHDPGQANQVILLTALVALAVLGVSFVIFFVRWITGKVHIPTEEEYQAAQHAIHGAEH